VQIKLSLTSWLLVTLDWIKSISGCKMVLRSPEIVSKLKVLITFSIWVNTVVLVDVIFNFFKFNFFNPIELPVDRDGNAFNFMA
jgi:hypothetical protein